MLYHTVKSRIYARWDQTMKANTYRKNLKKSWLRTKFDTNFQHLTHHTRMGQLSATGAHYSRWQELCWSNRNCQEISGRTQSWRLYISVTECTASESMIHPIIFWRGNNQPWVNFMYLVPFAILMCIRRRNWIRVARKVFSWGTINIAHLICSEEWYGDVYWTIWVHSWPPYRIGFIH